MGILLELAVDNLEDGIDAYKAGANRLEVVADLASQGLTPDLGLLTELFRRVPIPLVAMVRPRAGNFVYTTSEVDLTVKQSHDCIAAGASGIVVGVLTAENEVQREALRACIQAAHAAWSSRTQAASEPLKTRLSGSQPEIIFHRAFDFTPRPLEAMETLISEGCTRILTAGTSGWATPQHGPLFDQRCEVLAAYRTAAMGRIEIMPGGGIRPENIEVLLARTACRSVHTACRSQGGGRPCAGKSNRLDVQMVVRMRELLDFSPV